MSLVSIEPLEVDRRRTECKGRIVCSVLYNLYVVCYAILILVVTVNLTYGPFFESEVSLRAHGGEYLCLQILTYFLAFYANFTTPCLGYHFYSFFDFDLFIWAFDSDDFVRVIR